MDSSFKLLNTANSPTSATAQLHPNMGVWFIANVYDFSCEYEWDFGDPSGAYNKLPGHQGGHVYRNVGNYTVRLTVTDAHGAQSSSTMVVPIKTDYRQVVHIDTQGQWDALTPKSNSIYLIAHDLLIVAKPSQSLVSKLLGGITNVYWGSYGGGGKPRLRASAKVHNIFGMWYDTAGIQFENLLFDSDFSTKNSDGTPTVDQNGDPCQNPTGWMGNLLGREISVLNCDFDHVLEGVQSTSGVKNGITTPGATCVFAQSNRQVNPQGIEGHFIWGEGSNHVYLGNVGTHSNWENNVRTAITGIHDFLFFDNHISRKNARKATFSFRSLLRGMVAKNVSTNGLWMGIEPHPIVPGSIQQDTGVTYTKFDDNVQNDCCFSVKGNMIPNKHIRLRRNISTNATKYADCGLALAVSTPGAIQDFQATDCVCHLPNNAGKGLTYEVFFGETFTAAEYIGRNNTINGMVQNRN